MHMKSLWSKKLLLYNRAVVRFLNPRALIVMDCLHISLSVLFSATLNSGSAKATPAPPLTTKKRMYRFACQLSIRPLKLWYIWGKTFKAQAGSDGIFWGELFQESADIDVSKSHLNF